MTIFEYSSAVALAPNCRTRGKMLAAEAPPYSSADTSEGKTRCDANSGGNEEADSLSVLWAV